jgi:hypothetical protein
MGTYTHDRDRKEELRYAMGWADVVNAFRGEVPLPCWKFCMVAVQCLFSERRG